MCVIIVKPIGVDLPKFEDLENSFINNPDGAGFSYNEDGKVITKKGFMTYPAFLEHIKKVEKPTEKGMLIHFRISTHGGISQENTHPFPITNDIKFMGGLHTKATLVMAHNGIISSVNVPSGAKYSDTMLFIKNQVSIMKEIDHLFYLNEKYQKLLYTLSGSKLAFLDGQGRTPIIGSFTEHDGCQYSNASYNAYKYTYYGNYDEPYYGKKTKATVKIWLRPLPQDVELFDVDGKEADVTNDFDDYYISADDKVYFLNFKNVAFKTALKSSKKFNDINYKTGGLFEVGEVIEMGTKTTTPEEFDNHVSYYEELFLKQDIEKVFSILTEEDVNLLIRDYYGICENKDVVLDREELETSLRNEADLLGYVLEIAEQTEEYVKRGV